MNKRTAILCGVALAIIGTTASRAEVPASIESVTPGVVNYQGTMVTGAGEPYTNGVYSIQFRIWTASSDGTALWGSQYSVYVQDGYFNVLLGSPGGQELTNTVYETAEIWKAFWFDPADPQNDLYLGVKVLNTAAGEPIPEAEAAEAFPRQQMVSSPFAARAQMAQYAREAEGGFTVAEDLLVHGETVLNSDLIVTAAAQFSGATTLSGTSTFQTGIVVNGAVADLNRGLDVDGAKAYLRAGVEVTGQSALKGGVTVNGDGVFSNNVQVGGVLAVAGNGSMEKLTLGGFDNDNDPVLDFGGGYVLSGDNKGVSGGANRLVLETRSDGEVYIGPTNSTRLKHFQVKSDVTTFNGGTVNLVDVGSVNVEGNKPIVIEKYNNVSNKHEYDWNTWYSSADWSACVVGYDYGNCDIEETGDQASWKVICGVSGGTWHLYVRGHTEGGKDPDWTVHVMFIRKELVSDLR